MVVTRAVNAVAALLNRGIDATAEYAKKNAAAIALLLAVVYFVRSRYSSRATSTGHVLSEGSGTSNTDANAGNGTNGGAAPNKQEEMRQVRQRQQEIANQLAKEAEKVRKQKQEEERERKNHVAKKKPPTDGDRLGGEDATSNGKKSAAKKSGDSGTGGGYNPMQPWSSHTSGYRAARRNPRA